MRETGGMRGPTGTCNKERETETESERVCVREREGGRDDNDCSHGTAEDRHTRLEPIHGVWRMTRSETSRRRGEWVLGGSYNWLGASISP